MSAIATRAPEVHTDTAERLFTQLLKLPQCIALPRYELSYVVSALMNVQNGLIVCLRRETGKTSDGDVYSLWVPTPVVVTSTYGDRQYTCIEDASGIKLLEVWTRMAQDLESSGSTLFQRA